MSFQDKIYEFTPGYMRGQNISILLEAVGATLDAYAERVTLGRLASNPLLCEPDALEYHSRDRGIQLYPSEPLESRRFRLARWRQLHAQRGTHQGELRHLQPYFLPALDAPAPFNEGALYRLPKVRIVFQDGAGTSATWVTLLGDGTVERHRQTPSNWDWDGVSARWARFWVILYVAGTALETACVKYGSGHVFGEAGLAYGGIAAQAKADLVAMIRDWQSAHSLLWGFALARDATSFDPTATATTDAAGWTSLPTGNWGRLIDPATNKRTRLPSATWIYVLGSG